MPLLRKSGGEHVVYEYQAQGVLVAIEQINTSTIKKYWKKYKSKKDLPKDTITGYPFVFNEDQESFVIDFSSKQEFEICQLKKTE